MATTASPSNAPSQTQTQPQPSSSTTTTTTTNPPPAPSTQTGTFTLLLFASASSYTQDDTDTLTLPAPTTLGDIFTTLERRYPGITRNVLQSSAVTVNLEYVDVEFPADGDVKAEKREGLEGWDVKIDVGDEVGIIPPVSSG